jgi:phosphate/sulfate permease
MRKGVFMEILPSLIISPIISLLVCYITIYHSNKRSKEALEKQQRNHRENLELSEKKYQEQLAINEENERLKHLPYLSLVPKHKKHRFNAEMIKIDNPNLYSIPFEIINKGAGTAFSIYLNYLNDDSKPKNIHHIAVALQQVFYDHCDVLGVREPIDTDVLPVEDQTEFCLYLSAVDENSETVNPTSDLRWEFEIIFFDIQGRKYSQKYSFYTSTRETSIFRTNSEMPQLIEIPNNI